MYAKWNVVDFLFFSSMYAKYNVIDLSCFFQGITCKLLKSPFSVLSAYKKLFHTEISIQEFHKQALVPIFNNI